jgi:hypothetical protein
LLRHMECSCWVYQKPRLRWALHECSCPRLLAQNASEAMFCWCANVCVPHFSPCFSAFRRFTWLMFI